MVMTSALSIALSGLRAAQTQIETSSNNVANVATEGYTRQRVDQTPTKSRVTIYGPMGSGVDVGGVSRSRDSWVDSRVRLTSGQASSLAVRTDLGQRTEDVLGEPDMGVTASLGKLWSSFTALSNNPSDDAARTQVISSLNDFASRVTGVRQGMDGLVANAQQQLSGEVDAANKLADQVASLNALVPTQLSPELADKRDLAIDKLAQSVGATAVILPDGKARVSVNGMAIVDGDRVSHLSIDPSTPGVVNHPAGPATLGGTAGGLQAAISTDIPGFRARFDSFVNTAVTALNGQHALNLTPAGTAGGPLLIDSAHTLTVAVTQTSELAAADAAGGAQNGQGAAALAALRTTVDGSAATMVSGIAGDVANVSRSSDNAKLLSDAASSARLSLTGVNIDEEMTTMISEQRAYAAAARVVSTVDQMLDTLIKM
jgi:flagellar hook-associated protein 1 FlgK